MQTYLSSCYLTEMAERAMKKTTKTKNVLFKTYSSSMRLFVPGSLETQKSKEPIVLFRKVRNQVSKSEKSSLVK